MRRKLFNLATALSLVLCLATAALWVRSYWRYDLTFVDVQSKDENNTVHSFKAVTSQGRIQLSILRIIPLIPAKSGIGHVSRIMPITLRTSDRWIRELSWIRFVEWELAGFGLEDTEDWQRRLTVLMLPLWSVTVILAAMPVVFIRNRIKTVRANRRTSSGRCARCGYDLRATPERCPECGMAAGVTRNAE